VYVCVYASVYVCAVHCATKRSGMGLDLTLWTSLLSSIPAFFSDNALMFLPSFLSPSTKCICTFSHTHMHTRAHTRKNTHTHAHTHTHTHIHTHTLTQAVGHSGRFHYPESASSSPTGAAVAAAIAAAVAAATTAAAAAAAAATGEAAEWGSAPGGEEQIGAQKKEPTPPPSNPPLAVRPVHRVADSGSQRAATDPEAEKERGMSPDPRAYSLKLQEFHRLMAVSGEFGVSLLTFRQHCITAKTMSMVDTLLIGPLYIFGLQGKRGVVRLLAYCHPRILVPWKSRCVGGKRLADVAF